MRANTLSKGIIFVILLAILGIATSPSSAFSGPGSKSKGITSKSQSNNIFYFPKESLLRSQVKRANTFGLRRYSFAKVGDSNTEMVMSIYALGCTDIKLPNKYSSLQTTLDSYNNPVYPETWSYGSVSGVDCLRSNPFSRHSAASRSATDSTWPLTQAANLPKPGNGWASLGWIDEKCNPAETPLTCEIRLMKPRYTIIMIGSNDMAYRSPINTYTDRIDRLVDKTRNKGSIPVLVTLPPMVEYGSDPLTNLPSEEWVRIAGRSLVEYAKDNNIAIVNFWKAMKNLRMIHSGVSSDGVHLSYPEIEDENQQTEKEIMKRSVDFSLKGLRYGSNLRNLLTLQLLNRLNRIAP